MVRAYPAVASLLFPRPVSSERALVFADRVYSALLAVGVPEREVPRLERVLSTFVLGFALSEVEGRFDASVRLAAMRRVTLRPGELPAHHRLAAQPPFDGDAEFARDLDDLLALIAGTR